VRSHKLAKPLLAAACAATVLSTVGLNSAAAQNPGEPAEAPILISATVSAVPSSYTGPSKSYRKNRAHAQKVALKGIKHQQYKARHKKHQRTLADLSPKELKAIYKRLAAAKDPFPAITPLANAAVVTSYGQLGPHWKVAHGGTDFQASMGTPARAVVSGNVRAVFIHPAYGLVVELIRKDGVEIWYCHLSKVLVWAGQHVSQGAEIALTGASGNTTGPHLHFEVRVNHTPTDPMTFLAVTPGQPGDPAAWAGAYTEEPPEGTHVL